MDSKNKILIIDDDERNIFALSAMLRSKSFQCIARSDAREALALLQSNEPIDAILIDMMMPDMDGYEAIPLIKALENRQKVPIYAVTAQAMKGDREKCLLAGADDYIPKPINIDRLLELLQKI
ncbi:response regulator receiver domain-containing protein [Dyadobacter jejuensis]|uniref:Response regulator receiver domain-containing protein n=1 Tax=Dyadobacter jejuensis TaxID=1082580 RepID=A0A316AMT2_9BACT|nr:response regulator [Dyadobacter jejuensis]PWJ58852.1 response regulator receiver domain-containing protein [Dyadobacter jejuensis]